MAQLGICEFSLFSVTLKCLAECHLGMPDTIYLATYNYLGDVYDKYSVSRADLKRFGNSCLQAELTSFSHRLKRLNRFCVIFWVPRSPFSVT
jgi:hypothetical protein